MSEVHGQPPEFYPEESEAPRRPVRYAPCWLIRFQGTLTQGPNAGKSYTFATSWGGAMFASEAEARAQLDRYREREPALEYRIMIRQYEGGGFLDQTVQL